MKQQTIQARETKKGAGWKGLQQVSVHKQLGEVGQVAEQAILKREKRGDD